MSEENKAVVRRFYESFGSDLDTVKEVLAPDLVGYSHARPGPQTRDEHLQGIAMWNESFETRFDIEEQLAEGDRVATRVTMRAVHNRSEFMGVPPSGKEIVTTGISIERLKDGRIVHRRVESDWLGVMQQLGLIPAPQPVG
jgi:predicted ester cyclase